MTDQSPDNKHNTQRLPNLSDDKSVRNVPLSTSNLSALSNTSSGHKCPTCGFANRAGVLVCEIVARISFG